MDDGVKTGRAVAVLRSIGTVFLVIAGVVLACPVVCQYLETSSASFRTYEEFHASGYEEKGWIPSTLLPASATDIREFHDLDTNKTWIRFDFSATDPPSMENWQRPRDTDRFWEPRQSCRPIAWWPPELIEGCERGGRSEDTDFEYLVNGDQRLALDRARGRAYFWNLGGDGEPKHRNAATSNIVCPDLPAGDDAVVMGYQQLLYCRGGDGELTLYWEWLVDDDGVRTDVLWVLREQKWKEKMPPWARERRSEIVARVLVLTRKKGFDFIVEDY